MSAGFEFHELVPRPRGVRYVVRRDDFVEIAGGSRIAAELLHLLITELGVGLGRIADEQEREVEEELLTGPGPERSHLHPRFTQAELAGRLHCSPKTVRSATRELVDAGLLAIGRLEGETADNAYVYIVSLAEVRTAVAARNASAKAPKRPRIRLVRADGQKDPTGSAGMPNRLGTSSAPTRSNDQVPKAKRRPPRGKSEQPIDGENYGDSVPITERGHALSPLPITEEPVREELLRKANMPKALRALAIDELVGYDESYEGAVVAARAWAAGEADGLLVIGGAGRGKTTIAAAAAWGALRRREAIAWVLASELPRILAADFEDPALRDLNHTLNRSCGLVLDDVDQMDGKRAARQLSAVLAARIQAGRPLLITTSLDVDELEAEFGEKVVSRVLGYCTVAHLSGPNLHKLIAERRAA
jgi:DNA replication protein DnaC